MSVARCLSVLLVPAAFVSIVHFAGGQDLSGVPVKIQVTPVQGSSGKQVQIELLDPANQQVAAKKDIKVEVETKQQDGTTAKSEVALKQGEKSATAELPVEAATGIVEVTATSAQLADGGAVVKVFSADHHESPAPTSPPPVTTVTPAATSSPHIELAGAGASPATGVRPGLAGRPGRGFASGRAAGSITRSPASDVGDTTGGAVTGTGATSSFAVALPPSAAKPLLQFGVYPKKVRADGVDAATVWAALPDDYVAAGDFSISLISDLGPLTPEPITIPKGKGVGEARLVSISPGSFRVWYRWSAPPAQPPASALTIAFASPVYQAKLVPQQKSISLFDSVVVGVELADQHGTNVPADDNRQVNVHIDSGSGELSPTGVNFAPNESHKEIKFTPAYPGRIHLVAASASLPDLGVDIVVEKPWKLVGFGALGGLLGGALAYLTKKGDKNKARFFVGLLTGFVLYWLALNFGDWIKIPHSSVTNVAGAIMIPLIGGWIGTPVLAFVAKKLGMGGSDSDSGGGGGGQQGGGGGGQKGGGDGGGSGS